MSAFQRWLLWSTSALTGVTGLVYWWMDRFLEPLGEFAVINHPLQPWVLKAHIIVAPVLVFAVGVIWVGHVWKHVTTTMRRARRSGFLALWVLVPMVVSGYLIQAVTAPAVLGVLAWLHIGAGLAYLGGLVAHKLAVRATGALDAGGHRVVRRGPAGPRHRSDPIYSEGRR